MSYFIKYNSGDNMRVSVRRDLLTTCVTLLNLRREDEWTQFGRTTIEKQEIRTLSNENPKGKCAIVPSKGVERGVYPMGKDLRYRHKTNKGEKLHWVECLQGLCHMNLTLEKLLNISL